jgi:glyoxalase family protein
MIEAHKIRVARGDDHIDRERAADANEVLVDRRRRPFLTEGCLESPA